jgi:hypothetical protein
MKASLIDLITKTSKETFDCTKKFKYFNSLKVMLTGLTRSTFLIKNKLFHSLLMIKRRNKRFSVISVEDTKNIRREASRVMKRSLIEVIFRRDAFA